MMTHDSFRSQQILIMMETVRLRFTYIGHVMMQKSDKYFLAKKDYIPGCEKPTNQSPITLAKRMWQNELKLAPEPGDFVVDTVEDEEIEGFKGVRCVERAYIVDVKLRQPGDEKAIA